MSSGNGGVHRHSTFWRVMGKLGRRRRPDHQQGRSRGRRQRRKNEGNYSGIMDISDDEKSCCHVALLHIIHGHLFVYEASDERDGVGDVILLLTG